MTQQETRRGVAVEYVQYQEVVYLVGRIQIIARILNMHPVLAAIVKIQARQLRNHGIYIDNLRMDTPAVIPAGYYSRAQPDNKTACATGVKRVRYKL